jgi:hypothetical protein
MRARELEARQEEARWMADKSRGNQSSARKWVFRVKNREEVTLFDRLKLTHLWVKKAI